jgi:hypothetical protein
MTLGIISKCDESEHIIYQRPHVQFPEVSTKHGHETTEGLSTPRVESSPLEQLPQEVLAQVFTYAGGSRIVLPPRRNSWPWKLGHICSRWRKILWNTPELWGVIEITLRRRKTNLTASWLRNMESTLDDILSRRNSPLSLALILRHQSDKTFLSIFNIIRPHLCRFDSLTVHPFPFKYLQLLLQLPAGSLPLLETLDVHATHPVTVQLDVSSLQSATNLRRVFLEFEDINLTQSPSFPLPWGRLTDLSFGQIQPDILFILQHSPFLINLELKIYESPPPNSSFLFHEHLQSLFITTEGDIQWNTMLEPLVVPSLEHLTVSCLNRRTWQQKWSPGVLISLIDRSRCPLQTLAIHEGIFRISEANEPSPHTLLQRLPSLTTIVLPSITPPHIFQDISKGILLPQLKSGCWRVTPAGVDAILDWMDVLIDRIDVHVDEPPEIAMKVNVVCNWDSQIQRDYTRLTKRIAVYPSVGLDVRFFDFHDDPGM